MICRPILREYEIPLFDRSGAPEARQIALTDLVISIHGGKVALRSISHGRRVLPHLTCAHAFRNSGVPLYRFLASLEEQGTFSELSFSWGPLAAAPYLPRVVHGRIVLSLAQWNVSASALRRIDALQPTAAFVALQDMRERLRLPRLVSFVDSDNALPVDFENALSLQSFVRTAKRGITFKLSEVFPAPNELLAHGEDGRFHHELIVPFVRKAVVKGERYDSGPQTLSPYRPEKRKYPGSNWLFVKVYCSAAMADRVLTHIVSPLIIELQQEHAIDRWFFVRYADPQRHLRLRLRGEPSHLWTEVAPRLFASMNSARAIVHKVMVDTYDPEEERYGGEEGLNIAEKIFEADSDAALSIVRDYGGDTEARWRLGLFGMDALMDDCGFSVEQKRQTARWCQYGQITRYENYHKFKRQLGNSYRKHRREIETILRNPPELYNKGIQAIQARSQRIVDIAASLQQLENDGSLRAPRTAVVGSYLHMWANRIFRRSINAQEIVLYEFLHRIYEGRIERDRS